jgi:F420-dependent oxidoreductase-like protein
VENVRRRYGIVLGQRMPWRELLIRAIETEELGFDSLFLVDHFYGLKDLDDPTHEAYTALAAIAPHTKRLRLGVMVCGNTYRNPAFLLKQAVTVDHVSDGRVDFGVGAGWVEREHEAYGWDFPSAKERVDRFAEALEIWELLQSSERTTYRGQHYTLIDAPFQPKALQEPRLPVLIGGSGPRMMRLTARHADMWNGIGTPDELAEQSRRLDEACALEGRDPATLARTVSPSLNLLASVDAFEAGVAAYHAAGIRDIYLPWPRAEAEVPVLRQVAREVLPRLRGQTPHTTSRFRQMSDDDAEAVAAILREFEGTASRRVLDWLVDHPDERLDGAALQRATGIERHAEVTAALRERFRGLGLAPPWDEHQRGYLVSASDAATLRDAAAASGQGG